MSASHFEAKKNLKEKKTFFFQKFQHPSQIHSRLKKMKFEPSAVFSQVKNKTKTNIQSEPLQIKKIGKGSKKLKSAHKFSVI